MEQSLLNALCRLRPVRVDTPHVDELQFLITPNICGMPMIANIPDVQVRDFVTQ